MSVPHMCLCSGGWVKEFEAAADKLSYTDAAKNSGGVLRPPSPALRAHQMLASRWPPAHWACWLGVASTQLPCPLVLVSVLLLGASTALCPPLVLGLAAVATVFTNLSALEQAASAGSASDAKRGFVATVGSLKSWASAADVAAELKGL